MIRPFGVRGLILGLTIGLAIGVAWTAYKARRYIFVPAHPVPLWPLVRESRAYYMEGFLFFATQQGDQAIVGALLSPAVLAGYYIARRISDALGLILYAMEEVMAPTLARAGADGAAQVRDTFRQLTLAVGAFVLPAGVLAAGLAPAYVALVGRPHYAGLVPAVAILALGIIPQGGITVVSQGALGLGRPSDRLKITTTFAVLLLALTTATTSLGITALAAARVTASALAALLGTWFSRHLLPPVPWRDLSMLSLPTASMAAVLWIPQQLFQSLVLVPWLILGACFTFAGILYAILSPDHRDKLAAVFRGLASPT